MRWPRLIQNGSGFRNKDRSGLIRPKDGREFAAWCADELRRHLGAFNVVVNREVQVRPTTTRGQGRYTLSNINNTTPVFTAPKTRSSHTWIALSDRALVALRRQAERQRRLTTAAGDMFSDRDEDRDLVFTRPEGRALRPEYVLRRLHQLADDAGLPRVRVHDLRHFAATTMLSARIPVAMASKTMRHSTLSTTTEIYGHLLGHVAHQAVDVIDTALTAAEHELASVTRAARETTATTPPA